MAKKEQMSVSIENYELRAPDGGWGWMCVLGSALAHVLLAGIARSFGIIFVILREKFGSSAAVTAWIGASYSMIRFGGGPIAAALVNRFQFRRVVMIGGLGVCAGFIMSAFAPNAIFMFLSYGVVTGFFASLVWAPSYIIVAQYFDKKKGKAMGFSTVGSGFGGICMPWIIKFLADYYGFFGLMLNTGAIMLNCCVVGALYRSLQPTKINLINRNDENASMELNGIEKEEKTMTKFQEQQVAMEDEIGANKLLKQTDDNGAETIVIYDKCVNKSKHSQHSLNTSEKKLYNNDNNPETACKLLQTQNSINTAGNKSERSKKKKVPTATLR